MIAFEPLGFYEEFFVKDAAGEYRFAGVLECPDPAPRKLCAEGTEECVLTEPVTLRRGM